uniref:Uncharacterized protein n=1 Tax=Arundo donax TaxID=35708 RepID=A0A0A9BD98_ARUDO
MVFNDVFYDELVLVGYFCGHDTKSCVVIAIPCLDLFVQFDSCVN